MVSYVKTESLKPTFFCLATLVNIFILDTYTTAVYCLMSYLSTKATQNSPQTSIKHCFTQMETQQSAIKYI